jgi:hypothetical protein
MTRPSSSRRIVAEVPLFLDEAELVRVRNVHERLSGKIGPALVSELATLCRVLLLKGCAALEALPIDGEPGFLSDDDMQRALRAQAEERRAHDRERAARLEVAP